MVELVHPKPSLIVSLLDDDDTDQGQEEDMLENQTASTDTIMVS